MPLENLGPGPRYSDDQLSWWDGNRWKPLSAGPPLSADGHFWWNGSQWQPKHHGVTPKSGGGLLGNVVTFLGIGLMLFVANALGVINIQNQGVGGWTIAAAGYSCWIGPSGDWGKSYCGKDSGLSHLPNPPAAKATR